MAPRGHLLPVRTLWVSGWPDAKGDRRTAGGDEMTAGTARSAVAQYGHGPTAGAPPPPYQASAVRVGVPRRDEKPLRKLGRNNGYGAGRLSVGSVEIASGKCLLLPGDNIIPNNLTMPTPVSGTAAPDYGSTAAQPTSCAGVGAPGVFGQKFTVSPSALVFADLPSPGDQKGVGNPLHFGL
jgi:hypothetical protein